MKLNLFLALFSSLFALSFAASAANGPLVATCRSAGPIQGNFGGQPLKGPIVLRLSYAWTKAAGRYDLDYTGPTYSLGNHTRHFNIRLVASDQTARPEHFEYRDPSSAIGVFLTIEGGRGEIRYTDGKPLALTARLVCHRFD